MGLIFGAAKAISATMQPYLLPAGVGIMAVSQIQQGRIAAAEEKNRQIMADYQARVAKQEAKQIEALGEYEQMRYVQEAKRRKGAMIAAMGEAGAIPGAGTNVLVQAKQEAEGELGMLMIGYRAAVGAARGMTQAALDRMQATIYGERAGAARTAGYLGAAGTVLTGFGSIDWGSKTPFERAVQKSQSWLNPPAGFGVAW